MDVIHTAIWVSDLDEVQEYYEDVLGLEHTWRFELEGVTNYYVAGEADAEIQFKYDPDRAPPSPAGIDHIAVAVDDTEAVLERITSRTEYGVVDGPLEVEPANAYVAFVEAPDGYVVELVEHLD